jgi:hypothetical protein
VQKFRGKIFSEKKRTEILRKNFGEKKLRRNSTGKISVKKIVLKFRGKNFDEKKTHGNSAEKFR